MCCIQLSSSFRGTDDMGEMSRGNWLSIPTPRKHTSTDYTRRKKSWIWQVRQESKPDGWSNFNLFLFSSWDTAMCIGLASLLVDWWWRLGWKLPKANSGEVQVWKFEQVWPWAWSYRVILVGGFLGQWSDVIVPSKNLNISGTKPTSLGKSAHIRTIQDLAKNWPRTRGSIPSGSLRRFVQRRNCQTRSEIWHEACTCGLLTGDLQVPEALFLWPPRIQAMNQPGKGPCSHLLRY